MKLALRVSNTNVAVPYFLIINCNVAKLENKTSSSQLIANLYTAFQHTSTLISHAKEN